MALQKEVKAQFLLQNKSQVLGADLLTAALVAGRPSREEPAAGACGPASRSRSTPPHPTLTPTTLTPFSTNFSSCKELNTIPKTAAGGLLDSRAHSETRPWRLFFLPLWTGCEPSGTAVALSGL